MSQAFTAETGGLGGESADRVGGAFCPDCAVGIINATTRRQGVIDRHNGGADSS